VRYTLDLLHSLVTFEVVHFGTSTIRGQIGPASGDVTIDRAQRTGTLQATIDAAGVATGLAPLDALIKGPHVLAVQANPKVYFVATQFEFDASGQAVRSVRGELTLRGTSTGVTLRALRFNCYTSPLLRRQVCGGDFEGEFLRSTFDITHSLPFVADRVRLLVQVEAIHQP
jgi:polyisoprenoid-binding protein YceI